MRRAMRLFMLAVLMAAYAPAPAQALDYAACEDSWNQSFGTW